MGTDVLEIAIEIEREFGVDLAGVEPEQVVVMGRLHATITQRLRAAGVAFSEDEVWRTLCRIIHDVTRAPLADMHPDAHLVRDLGAE